MYFRKSIISAVSALVLSACGGGGEMSVPFSFSASVSNIVAADVLEVTDEHTGAKKIVKLAGVLAPVEASKADKSKQALAAFIGVKVDVVVDSNPSDSLISGFVDAQGISVNERMLGHGLAFFDLPNKCKFPQARRTNMLALAKFAFNNRLGMWIDDSNVTPWPGNYDVDFEVCKD